VAAGGAPDAVRTRDPRRRDKILEAAADLISSRGFHAVSMADIGAEAGITGSGIYRHFESKASILVALFDEIIDDLITEQASVLGGMGTAREFLGGLVERQVDFVVGKRELARVYYNEILHLPETDRVRLRRKQRMYVEEWVHLICEVDPDLSDSRARSIVQAAIGAIQSCLFYRVGLSPVDLTDVLTTAAHQVLRDGGEGILTAPAGARTIVNTD
jgi:AcrR family transcriptional regulator